MLISTIVTFKLLMYNRRYYEKNYLKYKDILAYTKRYREDLYSSCEVS